MSLKFFFQGTVIFLTLGSFSGAMASPLSEWEGSFIENEAEESMAPPRGFVDDTTRTPVPEEESTPLIEVALSPKRLAQLENRNSHKDLAMVPVVSGGAKEIKDDTATTGENEEKPVPLFLRAEQIQSPYLHQITQVVPQLISMDTH